MRSSLTALGRIGGNVVGAAVMAKFGAGIMYASFGVLSLSLAGALLILGHGLAVFAADATASDGASTEGCAEAYACACDDVVLGDLELEEIGVDSVFDPRRDPGGTDQNSIEYEALEVEG